MPMDRFLCHMCNSIVQYGDEKHPCFRYKNNDNVYTVPPANGSEVMERKQQEEKKRSHTGNSNGNKSNVCAATQRNTKEESKETNSLLIENHESISLMPASSRKGINCSMFPSEFLRGQKNNNLDSKSAACTSIDRDRNKAGTKSQDKRKFESAAAEFPYIDDSSSRGMSANSATFVSAADAADASVAGPSGIQMECHKTGKKTLFVCEVCGKNFSLEMQLNEHKTTHTGDKLLECPECGKKIRFRCNLNTHLLTHTGEKPFKCPECGRKFRQKAHLNQHLLTHTREKSPK